MSRQFLKPSEIAAIMVVLEHYADQDDHAYNFLKGFAAKPGDRDEDSPARRALNILKDKTGISV